MLLVCSYVLFVLSTVLFALSAFEFTFSFHLSAMRERKLINNANFQLLRTNAQSEGCYHIEIADEIYAETINTSSLEKAHWINICHRLQANGKGKIHRRDTIASMCSKLKRSIPAVARAPIESELTAADVMAADRRGLLFSLHAQDRRTECNEK